MNDIVIRAEGLGKKYIIGHNTEGERYAALRDVISRNIRGLARSAVDVIRGRPIILGDELEEFWALRDVGFEIARGDVVGFIGRNGAGKSTLLKILSQITEPTEGRVTIEGRVASLLEVGTGFHPELTGRENIFLNGAILGMARAEIKAKFDEIVAFAEIDKFLDTPVKRYSSGMYVRLAFAVAAHLDPEILVVDEVLAVGDANFQRKCIGKMQDVSRSGRTILFVSHNMAALKRLCSCAYILQDGRMGERKDPDAAVSEYGEMSSVHAAVNLAERTDRKGNGHLKFSKVKVGSVRGRSARMGDDLYIELHYHAARDLPAVNIGINVLNREGQTVFRASTAESGTPFQCKAGRGWVRCVLTKFPLVHGAYSLTVAASMPPSFDQLDSVEQATLFNILEDDVYQTGKLPSGGVFFQQPTWKQGHSVDHYSDDFQEVRSEAAPVTLSAIP